MSTAEMRTLLGLIAAVLLVICLGACGEAAKNASSRSSSNTASVTSASSGEAPSLRHLRGDEDDDETGPSQVGPSKNDTDADLDNDSKALEPKTYYDGDDASVRDYGQAADAADNRAIGATARRYYAAANAADGVRGCSLMYSTFVKAIPEDYGRGAGPQYSRGNTCAVVMSKLFRHWHSKLPANITVTEARVNGNQARAIIGSKTMLASYLPLQREHNVWKVDALLAMTLP